MKKLKLALSLSAFCFGIAMMVFGVFASSTIVYNISGQINYEINEALIDMTTNIYYSERLSTDTLTTAQIESKISECNMLTCDITSTDPTGVTKSSYSYNYNSFTGEGDGPVYTLPKLSFTNSTQVYYIIVRIDNLVASGTAGNVWTNATTTCGDNLVTYVSAKLPEITKGNAQNLVLVVGAKEIAEFDYQNYSFSISINIGAMPITATVDGETISTTYGTTWAEYISGKSEYATMVENDITYITKDGKMLKMYGQKLTPEDKIVDDAKYSTVSVTLKDSGAYWYTELGKLENGTSIRWRLVSLNGKNAYSYTNEEPAVGTDAVFVQETYSGVVGMYYEKNKRRKEDEEVYTNNYFEWYMRTCINTLDCWNLTELDVSSLVQKRNITGIEAYGVDGVNKYTGTIDDYFWLLSEDEVKAFFGDDSSKRIWEPDNITDKCSYVLRTPGEPEHEGEDEISIYFVDYSGDFIRSAYGLAGEVTRSAFQLA